MENHEETKCEVGKKSSVTQHFTLILSILACGLQVDT